MVISQGVCIVIDNDIESKYKAPCTIVSQVGAKRAILAIEDTVLTTFHPTNETDINKIEANIVEDEGLKIANNEGLLCLG